jgi:hypothetical protein
MAERYVIIRHKDGREYAILPADFDTKNVSPDGESYEAQGFKIVSYQDGEKYEAPKASAAKKD